MRSSLNAQRLSRKIRLIQAAGAIQGGLDQKNAASKRSWRLRAIRKLDRCVGCHQSALRQRQLESEQGMTPSSVQER